MFTPTSKSLLLAALLAMVLGQTAAAVDFVPTHKVDVGDPPSDPSPGGSYSFSSGTHTLIGSGSDWWGNGDRAFVAAAQMGGDWRIETDLSFVESGHIHEWAKAGIFVRNSLGMSDSGPLRDINAISAATGNHGGTFQVRPNANDDYMWDSTDGGSRPGKVALQRTMVRTWDGPRSYVEGFVDHGSGWERRNGAVLNLQATPYAGLFVTSHTNGTTETVNFTNTVVAAPVVPAIADMRAISATLPAAAAGKLGVREWLGPENAFGNLTNVIDYINANPSGATPDYLAAGLNIWDSDDNAHGHVGGDTAFGVVTAGLKTQGAVDQLCMLASGRIRITSAGTYTFCVNSDDGFELAIDGKVVAEANYGKGASDIYGSVALTAGEHDLRLLYWEGGGGSALELSSNTAPDGNTFALIGDTANGGLELVAPVPEPATWTLLAIGGLALLWWRRRG